MSTHKLWSYGTAAGSSGQIDKDRRRNRHQPGVKRIRVGRSTHNGVEEVSVALPAAPSPVPAALDAAAFLALVPKPMSWLKMQDLLYYAQGWHLVWDGEPLFADPILAVEGGVRVTTVDRLLNDNFAVTPDSVRGGDASRLGESARQTLSGIVKFYGSRNHFRLSEAIITELPWLHAREGAAGAANPEVSLATMKEYFSNR